MSFIRLAGPTALILWKLEQKVESRYLRPAARRCSRDYGRQIGTRGGAQHTAAALPKRARLGARARRGPHQHNPVVPNSIVPPTVSMTCMLDVSPFV